MRYIKVSVFERKSSWKRKDGKKMASRVWWARWRSRVGKDQARSLKTQSKREAQRMAYLMEEELNRPEVKVTARLTWEQAWELYALYHAPTIRRTTMVYRESSWREFWNWATAPGQQGLPIEYVDEVTTELVLRWRAYLMEAPEKKLLEGTINSKIKKCQTIIRKLDRVGVYDGPNGFSRIDHLPEAETTRDFLEGAEIDTFLARAAELDKELMLFCALGIYAGLRLPGEGLAVRWSWIHFQPDGPGGYIRVPKTDVDFAVKDSEARTIPLAHQLAEILRPHRGIGSAYVIRPDIAPALSAGRYRVCLRKLTDGIRYTIPGKNITPYSLRHTFASRCVQMGVPEFKIMKWMGHTSLRMLQRYAHLAPQDDDINIAFPAQKEGKASEEGS